MKQLLLMLASLMLGATVLARPILIEPRQAIPIEDWLLEAAISGDWAIATSAFPLDPSHGQPPSLIKAHLLRRDAQSQWQYVGVLYQEIGDTWQAEVAIDGNLAALGFPSGIHIFERTNAGWIERAVDTVPRPAGLKIAIDGGVVLTTESECSYTAVVLTQASPGHFDVSGRLPGISRPCGANTVPTDFELDIEGNQAIVWNGNALYEPPPHEARIFERSGNGWTQTATLSPPSNEVFSYQFGPRVAIGNGIALVSGATDGTHVYRRSSAGAWPHADYAPNYDAWTWTWHSMSLDHDSGRIFSASAAIHRGFDVIHVHQESGHGFEPVAMLAAPREDYVHQVEADGTQVLGRGNYHLYFFDLPQAFPAAPPVVQTDFQSGAPGDWTPVATSRFTVEQDGITQVWRQNWTQASAGAIHAADWTDQSIAADVRPLGFQGPDRWVGLVTRYQDESNYYYITLRDRDRISFKRMVNGQFTELGYVPVLVNLGQRYRLQLESSGTQHNVYVDGLKVLSVFDDSLSHGHPGIRMHRARADYDNIVIAPGARRAIFETPFNTWEDMQISQLSGSWSIYNDVGNYTLEQSDTNATARAIVGPETADQVLQVRMHLTGWGAGSPWAGLMARFVDSENYYYVTVRANGAFSLRKLTDGNISVLGTVFPDIGVQGWFDLRLEIVGTALRLYANDALLIETTDSTHARGTSGFMTYRAGARFDDYIAYQP